MLLLPRRCALRRVALQCGGASARGHRQADAASRLCGRYIGDRLPHGSVLDRSRAPLPHRLRALRTSLSAARDGAHHAKLIKTTPKRSKLSVRGGFYHQSARRRARTRCQGRPPGTRAAPKVEKRRGRRPPSRRASARKTVLWNRSARPTTGPLVLIWSETSLRLTYERWGSRNIVEGMRFGRLKRELPFVKQ